MGRPLSAYPVLLIGTTTGLLTLAACRGDRKPPPVPETDAPVVAPIPISRFNVPLDYDFTPIMRTVERVVPKAFGSMDDIKIAGDDSSKRYAYEARRGKFTAWIKDSLVHMRATLSYQARGYYDPPIGPTLSAGCGNDKERPRIIVELVSPLTLTEDWHLKSKARLARLEPASRATRDRCRVSLIKYDVTEKVVEAARTALVKQLPGIDRKIGEVDLTNKFQEWWGVLNRPIRLADSVWLMLGPERLRMGRLQGHKTVLTVETGLDAYPRIVTGSQPVQDSVLLPPLARDTVSNGFYIALEGFIDYATASRTVTEALRERPITQAGQTITIQSVLVQPGTHGRVVVQAEFDGDVEGALQFIGRPMYDAKQRVIAVPDLDYDLETDSKLVNTYKWLRSDALRDLFREKATVSVDPALDEGKKLLANGLNRKVGSALTLSASIDSVAARNIYVTARGLTVRAEAMGQAGVSVRQK